MTDKNDDYDLRLDDLPYGDGDDDFADWLANGGEYPTYRELRATREVLEKLLEGLSDVREKVDRLADRIKK